MLAADAQVQVRGWWAAQLAGHVHQTAHALLVQLGEGIVLVDLLVVVSARNLPASSRVKPKVIWVRSLVPKEKNSASLAISSAVRAARGSRSWCPPGTSCRTPAALMSCVGGLDHDVS